MSGAQVGGKYGEPQGPGPSLTPPTPGCFAAPPQMDESSCPSHQTWLEGAKANVLACVARGRPSPRVLCSREGVARPERQRVSREDAGTYRCVATNAHGTDSRTVTVGVECEWRPAPDGGQSMGVRGTSPSSAIGGKELNMGII